MCGIFAVLGRHTPTLAREIIEANRQRGRDGYGSITDGAVYRTPGMAARFAPGRDPFVADIHDVTAIGNCRAEPTTELVFEPTQDDQQPYTVGDWAIVHNGVIANDKELCVINGLQPTTRIDSWVIAALLEKIEREHELAPSKAFEEMLGWIEGSFAILATHKLFPGVVFYACNYRPLYAHTITPDCVVLSSVRITPSDLLVNPYSHGMATKFSVNERGTLLASYAAVKRSTLVVISGGLDSTAVAAICKNKYGDLIELLHFDYGCRATAQERHAVGQISKALDAPLHVVNMRDIFTQIGGSRLTGTHKKIDNGEKGAERAIEWVPARNTILASVAMGIAEASGFDQIALGINLEESGGGYTDNVLDLYEGFNSLMQWIVGEGKRLAFISPVGHMMKHEIVSAGIEAGAPFELTWSCYNNGDVHCGNCGPCIMRRRAFERGGYVDPVPFAAEEVK